MHMSSMCRSGRVGEELAHLDAALAVLPEREGRAQGRAGLALGAEVRPGSGLPWYFASIGLGSNVSTCDGPPFMNRWTTCLAFPGKWGAFGAIGPSGPDESVQAETVEPRRLSSARTPASPIKPNPMPLRPSSSRRVRKAGLNHYDMPIRVTS